jgi:hypothetical protein
MSIEDGCLSQSSPLRRSCRDSCIDEVEKAHHLPELANDLVANKADAILTLSYPAAMAAKNATLTFSRANTSGRLIE